MLTQGELLRMNAIERRIKEIAEECELSTTDIDFEVVSARRMIEAMAYHFPTNISHWSYGRDYDRIRTIYEHTGGGIPYEVVWNFDRPRAYLVASNPFALNVLTVAHVYGHVDFFLRNKYLQHGRSFGDIAEEARHAATQFRDYEDQYGKEMVERVIDAGMAIQWHQNLDPFYEEQDEEMVRAYLMRAERDRLVALQNLSKTAQKASENEKKAIETRLKALRRKTPPEPVFDILKYVVDRAPLLEDWERKILRFIRNQARSLAPNRRTQLLNEGWATYWHARIMRRLFDEGLLTSEEHGVYLEFHAKVTQANKADLNVYCVGPAIYEYVKSLWDKGQFGKEYEECVDPAKKERWDTKAMKGTGKIFEVSECYTSRMAAEEFFTPEFIHSQKLYIYEAERDEKTGEIVYKIATRDPEVIRAGFKNIYALFDMPTVAVIDGNYNDRGELYLRHHYDGKDLHPSYRNGVLSHLYYLWRRPVYLESAVESKAKMFSYDGSKHYEST